MGISFFGGGGTGGTDAIARTQASQAATDAAAALAAANAAAAAQTASTTTANDAKATADALKATDIKSAVPDATPGDEKIIVTRTNNTTYNIDMKPFLTGGGTAATTAFDNVVAILENNPANVQAAIEELDAVADKSMVFEGTAIDILAAPPNGARSHGYATDGTFYHGSRDGLSWSEFVAPVDDDNSPFNRGIANLAGLPSAADGTRRTGEAVAINDFWIHNGADVVLPVGVLSPRGDTVLKQNDRIEVVGGIGNAFVDGTPGHYQITPEETASTQEFNLTVNGPGGLATETENLEIPAATKTTVGIFARSDEANVRPDAVVHFEFDTPVATAADLVLVFRNDGTEYLMINSRFNTAASNKHIYFGRGSLVDVTTPNFGNMTQIDFDNAIASVAEGGTVAIDIEFAGSQITIKADGATIKTLAIPAGFVNGGHFYYSVGTFLSTNHNGFVQWSDSAATTATTNSPIREGGIGLAFPPSGMKFATSTNPKVKIEPGGDSLYVNPMIVDESTDVTYSDDVTALSINPDFAQETNQATDRQTIFNEIVRQFGTLFDRLGFGNAAADLGEMPGADFDGVASVRAMFDLLITRIENIRDGKPLGSGTTIASRPAAPADADATTIYQWILSTKDGTEEPGVFLTDAAGAWYRARTYNDLVAVDETWFVDGTTGEDSPALWTVLNVKKLIETLGEPIFLTGTNEEMKDRRFHIGTTSSAPALTLATGNANFYAPFFNTDTLTISYYVADPADATKLIVSTAAKPAKNALVYPVGNFTALPVNDAGTGTDGAVYRLPSVDDLQITLPNKATMNAAEGIYRVRISGDWPALATQTTPLSFIDDATNSVDMGEGLPTDGSEWLDLIWDAAADRWRAVSGGEVVLNHIVPTYQNVGDVPANVRLYLIDGTGASAEGLYRRQTADNAPNYIG